METFYIRTINTDENGSFGFTAPLERSDEDFLIWRENRHRGFGRCHSAYPGKKLRQLMIYYMKITLKESVKVYLHHKGTFLDLNGKMGTKVMRGTRVQMPINWEQVKMLDQSIKSQQSGYKCKASVPYDKCMYAAVIKAMVAATADNCTVPWVPFNGSICTSVSDRNISYWTHYTRITNQQADCPNPCTFLQVTAGGQNREAAPENMSQVSMYFQSKTQINEESMLYTTLSLFAEIGGYVGLLLGVAIFHLTDLINLLLNKLIKRYIKRNEEKQQNFETEDNNVCRINHLMRSDSEQF